MTTNSPETFVESGAPLTLESRGDMPDRFPNHTQPEDPSAAFQALHRHRGMHRFIVAFTRRVASARLSLVSRPSPPDFLPSASLPFPSGTHHCSSASSISHKSNGTHVKPSSQPLSWTETPGQVEAPGPRGLPRPFAGLSVPEPPPHTRHHTWTPGAT